MKPEEVRALPAWCLRLIVLVEARAAPEPFDGFQSRRRATKTRPGRMTDFIRREGLLPPDEVDAIILDAPRSLILFQEAAAMVPLEDRPAFASWLERFRARDVGTGVPMRPAT